MPKAALVTLNNAAAPLPVKSIEQDIVLDMLEKECLALLLDSRFFVQYLLRYQSQANVATTNAIEDCLWDESSLLGLYSQIWDIAGTLHIPEANLKSGALINALGEIYDEAWLGNIKEADLLTKFHSLPLTPNLANVITKNAEWKFYTNYGYIHKNLSYH